MKHKFVLPDGDNVTTLAKAIIGVTNGQSQMRTVIIFETDLDAVAGMLAASVPGCEALTGSEQPKKTAHVGICAGCGRQAALVKKNQLCYSCNHKAKDQAPADGVHPAEPEHVFVPRASEKDLKLASAEDRLQANIDKVVKAAQAKGEPGNVSLPLSAMAMGTSQRTGRKLG